MSRPLNPLSKFRSYSYYHVLAICESACAADELSLMTKPDKWLHPSAPNSALGQDDTYGRLGPNAVQYTNEAAKTGRYCILINGATDATFSIVQAKWSSFTGAEVTMLDQSTSMAIEGDLEISEPKGIVFLDIIVECCQAMGIDAANAVFVLKTFFIGHADTDDVPSDEYYISDIEPLRFITYHVTGSFAETGGLYHLSFVALTHGASRLPQFGKSASGLNIKGGTLLETFENLAGVVQANYDELYECVTQSVKDEILSNNVPLTDMLTRVNYEFELDSVYQTSDYLVSDAPKQIKDKDGCERLVNVTVPANMSIEDAIHIIMKKCPKVTEEAAKGVMDSSGKVIHYEYKIHAGVDSCRAGSDSDVEYTVIYRVERFMRPKSASLFEIAAGATGSDLTTLTDAEIAKLSSDEQKLRANLIAFDYIYTGKNIDILEFDMKMNMGMVYIQIASTNNTLKDQLQAVPTAVTHVPQYDKDKPTRFGAPTKIPVFFGTQIRSPQLRNKQSSSSNAEAGYSLSKHASVEVLDVTMKIHGNPRLVGTVNRASAPSNIGKVPVEQNDNVNREANWLNWGSFPSFAKVNIKMPRNNDDISLFRGESIQDPEGVGGRDFTRDFWFTGFYYVIGIEHHFEGGEFFQVLSMIGIPQTQATKIVNRSGQNKQEADIQKKIQSCYSSHIEPCDPNFVGRSGTRDNTQTDPGPPPAQVAVSPAPPLAPTDPVGTDTSKAAPPTNLADATVATRSIDPNNVRGWKTADPATKQAISDASRKHGVDEGFMVAMAQKESNFKVHAVNKTTDARGLYQFIPSTWNGTKPGYGIKNQFGKQLGLEGKTPAQVDAARFDPRINAEAAALLARQNQDIIERSVGNGYKATAGDLYLAHFQGPNDATKLIKANPSASVESTLGTKRYNQVVKANPSYAKYKTVGAWRANNARGLTGSSPGIRTVQSNKDTSASPQRQTSGAVGVLPSQDRIVANKMVDRVKANKKVAQERECMTKKEMEQKRTCTETAAPATEKAAVAAVRSSIL